MFCAAQFRELISGKRRGGGAAVLRGVLRAAEVPYTIAVDWRNRRYDRGHAVVHHARVPVISVGNLTLGGTGKTPMVKWLVRWLASRGLRAAIVSRGYGARNGRSNDEAMELHDALPDVPHMQDADRVAAARRVIDEFHCQVVVLDDGFQHRRLERDLDIVLLDALEPFGHEHVFPRGTLREPMAGLRRADVICLSRADTINAEEREHIRTRVLDFAPNAVWCEVTHAPSGLLNGDGQWQPIGSLEGKRVAAFCGIGNPAGFRHTLSSAGAHIAAWREFPDHHAYREFDLREVQHLASKTNAELITCTHKDLVKLRGLAIERLPLWAITVDLQFTSRQLALEELVQRTILPVASQPPALPGVDCAPHYNGVSVAKSKTPGGARG